MLKGFTIVSDLETVIHTVEVDGMVQTFTMPADTRMDRVSKALPGKGRWWHTATTFTASNGAILLRITKKYRVSKRGHNVDETLYVHWTPSPLVSMRSEPISSFAALRCGKSEVAVKWNKSGSQSGRTK